MATGVLAPETGSLQIRKDRSGNVTLDAPAPRRHEFPREFLTRELNRAVRVYVVVPTEEPLVYEVNQIGLDRKNVLLQLIGTQGRLPVQAPKPKWWQWRKRRGR